MRTLGPGSVSSFLQIVVEVIHAALWVLLGAQLVTIAAILLAEPFGIGILKFSPFVIHVTGVPRFSGETPAVAMILAISAVYVAILLVVFRQLRRVLATLTRGDPFHPDNVRRLRTMGIALVGLEASGYLVRVVVQAFARMDRPWPLSVSATGWLAVLVVFVLAEVFREGARLRREAELTV